MIAIQDEISKIRNLGLWKILLADKTTKANILWATDAYCDSGEPYCRNRQMTEGLITVCNIHIIRNRAEKALEQQTARTRQHAEVFTPLWICEQMNDHADEALWKDKTWQSYVDSRVLEITCGEAPYLVSRYDVSTGESITIEKRIGLLDRKLRVISENCSTEQEWLRYAMRAYQSTYGYEFQGDNLLIARINLLMTFIEYYTERWKKEPDKKTCQTIANVIAWNLWQMDGINGKIPYCHEESLQQMDLFAFIDQTEEVGQPNCRIFNWRKDRSIEFANITKGEGKMKFDFIIGNPPYQDETLGENVTFAPPIYHKFMDNCFPLATSVELIHPARFLFNAGSTPKQWNEKMLKDEHLKVLWYEADSSKVFANTDIKGGVAITYHNSAENYGAIGTFTAYMELNSISRKVKQYGNFESFSKIILSRTAYRLTEKMHSDHPEALAQLSKGHPFDMSTNIFDRLPQIFFDEVPCDGYNYIQIYGRTNNERVYKYIRREYVNNVSSLDFYKIFVPKSNGSGAIGEVLSTPLIGAPLIGATESFISIGKFDTEMEATACFKYIKSKFARTMLGILKVTQDNPPDKWYYVPMQDFTSTSDIDWSKSVAEIDRQLYGKYGLDEQEIAFIEKNVKEMD